ncbi:hypothetical protein [Spirillospora sp. CA-294931]|uniref:hypothetical protein n=1 Tax=Spirillospora sp. CA-294931 TaxID=3240042 RepID=UPI003D8DCC3C
MDYGLRKYRLLACYGTVVACLPYLVLKVIWIGGGNLGVGAEGQDEMHSDKYVVANVVTAGMELVAVLVAMAFTYEWGRRIPAWIVLVPVWVGTGLLAPFVVGLPSGLLVQAVVGGSAVPDNDGAMGTWVFAVIYGGFIIQGVTLLAAFVLYARVRWAPLFETRTYELPSGTTREVQVLLARGAAVGAVLYAVLRVGWALRSGEFETAAQKTFVVVGAPLALLGAAATLALVERRGNGSLLPVLGCAWIGAGSLFACGFTGMGYGGAGGTMSGVGLVAGLLLGVACLLSLAEGLASRTNVGRAGFEPAQS